MLFTTSVYARSPFDKFEEYQFNPDFENSGEMIGHALKTTTVKIFYTRSCVNMVKNYAFENLGKYMHYADSVSVKSSIGAKGSGFVLTNDGYIVTNEHVICWDDYEDRLQSYIANGAGKTALAKMFNITVGNLVVNSLSSTYSAGSG